MYTASGIVSNPVSRQIDGEIQAAKEAINWCLENIIDKVNTKIEIYHDYEGLGKWADNLWKTNKPLTTEYKLFVSNARFSGLKVYFIWEKGHNNNFFNEIADELATSAVENSVG
ncbi:Rnase H [Enterococcus phage VRE9_4]